MKCLYRIRYVGDDSHEHHTIVRAENSRLAKQEVKRRGAEFVKSVKPVSFAWLWGLLVVIVVVILLLCP